MRETGHLSKNGNCHCVIISRRAMAELRWSAREEIVTFVENGRIVIASLTAEIDKHHRAAAELLAAIDEKAPA